MVEAAAAAQGISRSPLRATQSGVQASYYADGLRRIYAGHGAGEADGEDGGAGGSPSDPRGPAGTPSPGGSGPSGWPYQPAGDAAAGGAGAADGAAANGAGAAAGPTAAVTVPVGVAWSGARHGGEVAAGTSTLAGSGEA
jgi:hypothetical protein